jgi:hypothetical protein
METALKARVDNLEERTRGRVGHLGEQMELLTQYIDKKNPARRRQKAGCVGGITPP